MNFFFLSVAMSIFISLPSPEPEKTWLCWVNFAPRNGAEQQYHADEQKQDAESVAQPSPNEQHQTASDAKTNSPAPTPSSIWEKAFAPEAWSQWGQVIAEVALGIIAIVTVVYFIRQVRLESNALRLAKETAKATKVSEEFSTRAKIAVEMIRIVPAPDGSRFTYSIILHNYGGRPADIIEQSFTCMAGWDEDMIPAKPVYWPPGKKATVLHPDKRLTVNDDEWFFFHPDNKKVVAFGYFKYLDGFGQERVTGYGVKCVAGGQVNFMTKPGYNYAT